VFDPMVFYRLEPSFLGLNSSATPPPSAKKKKKNCLFSHAPPQSSNHIESHAIRQIFRRSSQICPENLLPTIHALSRASRSSCRFLTRSTRHHRPARATSPFILRSTDQFRDQNPPIHLTLSTTRGMYQPRASTRHLYLLSVSSTRQFSHVQLP